MYLIKKNAKAYKYNYTDLAEITKLLHNNGIDYYQYTQTDDNGADYIMTVVIPQDGEPYEVRGCKIIEPTLGQTDNPAQAYGAAITYARRYSLLMCFGLATTDDDAASLKRSVPASTKEIQQYETICQRRNIDPQTYFKAQLKGTGSYKNMSANQYGLALRMINEGEK